MLIDLAPAGITAVIPRDGVACGVDSISMANAVAVQVSYLFADTLLLLMQCNVLCLVLILLLLSIRSSFSDFMRFFFSDHLVHTQLQLS